MPYGWNAKQIRSGIDPGSPAGALCDHWPKRARQQDTATTGCGRVAMPQRVIDRHQATCRKERLSSSTPMVAWDDRGVRLRQQGLRLSGPPAHGRRPDQRGEDARTADGSRRCTGGSSSPDPRRRNLQADRAGPADRNPGPHVGASDRIGRHRGSKRSQSTRSRRCSIRHCRPTNANAASAALPKGRRNFHTSGSTCRRTRRSTGREDS